MHRLQNRLSIYPMVNLVTNIGLHSIEATHTTARNDDLFVPSEEMKFPLKHPVYIKANVEIDDFTVAHQFFLIKGWCVIFRHVLNIMSFMYIRFLLFFKYVIESFLNTKRYRLTRKTKLYLESASCKLPLQDKKRLWNI